MCGRSLWIFFFKPPLGTLFLLLSCHIHPLYDSMCLVLLYLIKPCLVDVPGRPAPFWREMEEQRIWGIGKVEGNWGDRKEEKLRSGCIV